MRASSALRFRLFLGGWKKRLARLATMGAVGVLVRDGVLLLGGELRADEDGRETSEPAGEEVRLVVAGGDDEDLSWESATFATRDGAIYQRRFYPWRDAWEWSGPRSAHCSHANGELVVNALSGHRPRTLRLVRAVALAWVEPPRHPSTGRALQAVHLAGDGLDASGIAWCPSGTRPHALVALAAALGS